MGDLFESGIRALTSLSFQEKPCKHCDTGSPHSPFYCANFYEQHGERRFKPISPPVWVQVWIDRARNSECYITRDEVSRYEHHIAHKFSPLQLRRKVALETVHMQEVILQAIRMGYRATNKTFGCSAYWLPGTRGLEYVTGQLWYTIQNPEKADEDSSLRQVEEEYPKVLKWLASQEER